MSASLDFSAYIAERTHDFTGREWVFAEVDRWLENSAAGRVFTLAGGPGTGKSAIAARLVQINQGEVSANGLQYLRKGSLSFFHFCQASNDSSLDALRFVESLSKGLAGMFPTFRDALLNLGDRNININATQAVGTAEAGSQVGNVVIQSLNVINFSARQAFDRVIRKPLEALEAGHFKGGLVALVDSMDEAMTYPGENVASLLGEITRPAQPMPVPLRFILTGRFEDQRLKVLFGEPNLDLTENAPPDVDEVRLYAGIGLDEQNNGPRKALADKVAQASKGNFLYARYVLDDLLAGKMPAEQIELDRLRLPAGLDEIYAGFLQRELGRSDEKWEERYSPLLGLLVVARSPGLLREHLIQATRLPESKVDQAIKACSQYLSGPYPDGPFSIYHQSFREFLVGEDRFKIHPAEAEQSLVDAFLTTHQGKWGECQDEYALIHGLAHLNAVIQSIPAARSEKRQGYLRSQVALLMDFEWMQAKLSRTDIFQILVDYEQSLSNTGQIEDEELQGKREVLRLLQRAIRQSAHILAEDPRQLASQLLGRLPDGPDTRLRAVLKQVMDRAVPPYLRPVTASLQEPEALVRILAGHRSSVLDVAVTPDGSRAVSASLDTTLKVWDMSTNRELSTLTGHQDAVGGLAITPDGHYVVSASTDRTLKVWDLASGNELLTLSGHEWWVNGVAITPDGRYAISASQDKTLKIWDLVSGNLLKTMAGHTAGVRCVTVTSDGRRAISGSWDGTLKVWDLSSGRELRTLEGHESWVNAVALTPDDRLAVSASDDNTLRIWDINIGCELRILTGHVHSVNGVAITADGSCAVSASDDGTIKIWNLTTGKELDSMGGGAAGLNSIAIMPDGQHAVSASTDGTIKFWNLADSKQRPAIPGHARWVNSLAVTPEGRFAVSASQDNTLKIWDITSGQDLRSLIGHTSFVKDVALTSDSRLVVSASTDATLKVWDLATGRELFTLSGHDSGVNLVKVTPDDTRAISAAEDEIKIWDLTTRRAVGNLRGHGSDINSIAITPDGSRLVSASSDETLIVWDLASRLKLLTLKGHTSFINHVAVTPDGKRAISASLDNTVKVWDLASGLELQTLHGHTDAVNRVALTSDGRHAVSASQDATLRYWDLAVDRELYRLAGHRAGISSVILFSQSPLAASSSFDRTLKIWDLTSGVCLTTFNADADLDCLAAAPPATLIAGASSGRVHFLRLESGRLDI